MILLCPCCGRPLSTRFELRQGGLSVCVVWCGYGPCESMAANEGAEGKTFDEAIENLDKALEREGLEYE